MKKANILNITFTIIGTIIGAGFASGKEIYVFFNIYGKKGIFGLLISFSIISLIIYKTLNFTHKNNINTYEEFLNLSIKNKYLKYLTKVCINVFLLSSFYIMVCGFSTYFVQEFGIHYIYGAITISIFSYIVFRNNIDGIIKTNKYLIPILILFVFVLGIKVVPFEKFYLQESVSNNLQMVIKAILYASYNSIILIPILVSFNRKITNKTEIKKITILVWIIMLSLSLIIFIILALNYYEAKDIDIPIVYIANRYGTWYKYIYGIVIAFAIFTSAIAAGYGFITNTTEDKKAQHIINIIICCTAIFISRLGFSNLVNCMYPIFGFFGLYQIFLILLI